MELRFYDRMRKVLCSLAVMLIMFNCINVVLAANLDVKMSGEVNDYSADFIMRTNPASSNGFDRYDMIAPSSPSNYSRFYSSITGYSLSIDSWNANDNPRTLNLVYAMDEAQTGTLTVSWETIPGGYSAVLKDYGADSSYSVQLGGNINMASQSSYEKTLSSNSNIYLQVAVDTVADTTTGSTGGGAGGGAGGVVKKISLKIEVPSPITIYETGTVEVPIKISNNGDYNFYNIDLTSYVMKDGDLSSIESSLDKTHFGFLSSKQKEDAVLKVNINEPDIALYEVVINASAKSPLFNTDSKVYINFATQNASGIKKMVVFAEDMIVENPECLELREMVDEAKEAFERGDEQEAIVKAQTAVEACRESISGIKKPVFPKLKDFGIEKNIVFYLAVGIIAAIVFGIMFNIYKMRKFKKKR